MSKITNKNLSYNSSLPPFLARLRGEAGGGSSYDGPDPILSARRRPVKPRSGSAEAEDAPTVVDAETGEVVRGVSVKDGVVTSLEVETPRGEEGDEVKNDEGVGGENGEGEGGSGKKEEAKLGEGLMKRKRKVGRVVGAEREEDGEGSGEKGVDARKDKDEGKGKSDGKGKSAGKKRAKKIKLSFGDEEG